MRISDWSSDVCSSDLDTPTVEEAPPEAPVEPEVAVEPEVIEEPPVVEAPPAVKPRFRDRLGKARSTLSGYLGGIRASGKVDAQHDRKSTAQGKRVQVGVDLGGRRIITNNKTHN